MTHYYYYKYFLIIIGCFNVSGKRWRAFEEKFAKVKDELANNSVACGTASYLPCDFVFLNFGKKFLS